MDRPTAPIPTPDQDAPTPAGHEASHFTYATLAEFLHVKVGTIQCWVYRKQIPHIRLSSRCVRFPRADILRWLQERAVNEQPH